MTRSRSKPKKPAATKGKDPKRSASIDAPSNRRPTPAGASARRERRRQTLAGAVLSGQKITDVARREGVTRTYASHEANTPETRLLMAELLAAHRKQVGKLLAKSLTRIGQAMDAYATEIVVSGQERTKDKAGKAKESRTYKSILAGVDHYARMTGVKRLTEMIQAARSDAGDQRPVTVTLEQFLNIFPEVAK